MSIWDDIKKEAEKTVGRFWMFVAIVIAVSWMVCISVIGKPPTSARLCTNIADYELCFPADPGGHIVVVTGGSQIGLPGKVSLYKGPVGATCSVGGWVGIEEKTYTAVPSSEIVGTTPNPMDSNAPFLGAYGWSVRNKGCYAVGFKEQTSPPSVSPPVYAAEKFSGAFKVDPAKPILSVVACKSNTTMEWRWVDGLGSCN